MAKKHPKPMTVLVVSETLTRGGLETRLLTQGTALVARGHRVLYATASPEVPGPLAALAERSFTRLGLGLASSANDCADAAEELARIIREHEVDVVHAHPFASLVGAGLGAALAGVPLTVTAHGPTSFTGPPNLDAAIFDVVLPYASSIRLVSEELRALLPTALWPRLRLVPNAVDLARFQRLQAPPARGPWAFIGRLDDGKSRAAAQLIDWAPALGIDAVHIVGAGAEAEALQRRAASSGVDVKLLGWRDDVAELLRGGYAGVAGMGRVVLEAAALGLPCILAGYEHLHGLVTPERFPAIAFSNFSGRGLPPAASADSLALELRQLDDGKRGALRALLEASHDEAKLVRRNEALLAEARVVEEARPAVLQLHGLLRRAPVGPTPWVQDPDIALGLEQLARRHGVPPVSRTLSEAVTRIDANTRQTVAEQHRALTAHLEELRASVTALSARLDVIAERQSQTPLRLAWKLAKESTPGPLKRTVKPLTARLRGLLKP